LNRASRLKVGKVSRLKSGQGHTKGSKLEPFFVVAIKEHPSLFLDLFLMEVSVSVLNFTIVNTIKFSWKSSKKFFRMYTTYILYSVSLDRYYIGYTSTEVEVRLGKHMAKHKGFTSKADDWIVKYFETYPT
jgi:hypothetical protein